MMKKQIVMTVALFVALGVANAQHNHGTQDQKAGSKMDHAKHSGMKMAEGQVMHEVSVDFKKQLTEVFKTSLVLTESFISSEAKDVASNGSQVKAALSKVDMGLLKSSEAHMDWMMNLKKMNSALDKITKSKDLKEQKVVYASFNQALYKSIKAFGISEGTVYYQHCPMALDNKGAYWLSDREKIRNPYLDKNMLTCGSTKETIN